MTNGMKPGAGSDPFADEESDAVDDTTEETVEDVTQTETQEEVSQQGEEKQQDSSHPWLFIRDGVKQSRDHTFQLHLRSDTRKQEKRFQTTVEELLGEDVYRTDLREAALLVAMQHPDEVADCLRNWGYDLG